MRVYTFHLRKGGDGKTTLTGNVGWGLARRGTKTCIIDCDTQANLSTWLAGDRGEYELADYFEGRCSASDAVLTINDDLDMIVTAKRNSDLVEWEKVKLNEKVFVFRRLIRDLEALGYDAVFFDLPPTFTTLHSRVYLAVDEVIASSTPSLFSEEGLANLLNDLESVNEDFEVDVKYSKLILGKIDNRISEHKIRSHDMSLLRDQGYEVFFVPTSTAFSRSQEIGQTIYTMKDAAPARKAIESLVDVLEEEIHGKAT